MDIINVNDYAQSSSNDQRVIALDKNAAAKGWLIATHAGLNPNKIIGLRVNLKTLPISGGRTDKFYVVDLHDQVNNVIYHVRMNSSNSQTTTTVLLGTTDVTSPEDLLVEQSYPDQPAALPFAFTEPVTSTENNASAITQAELVQGWYFGAWADRKPGTPVDWEFVDEGGPPSGRSMWRAPLIGPTASTQRETSGAVMTRAATASSAVDSSMGGINWKYVGLGGLVLLGIIFLSK